MNKKVVPAIGGLLMVFCSIGLFVWSLSYADHHRQFNVWWEYVIGLLPIISLPLFIAGYFIFRTNID
ncbi:MAG: hypothetical protein WC238_03585 [Parcubacteria group bacterium]|jgi:hypothetical protein